MGSWLLRPVFWDTCGCFDLTGMVTVPLSRTGCPVFWAGVLFLPPRHERLHRRFHIARWQFIQRPD